VIKISAVAPERHIVSAPAAIFDTEAEVKTAFHDGKLDRDVVVVLRGQGPKAAGMPELHSLTPLLSILQDKGYQVALVTDGRMSGASGSVPAAIHLWPEAADGGAIASLRDGDIITLDAVAGRLETDASLDSRNGAEIITKQAGFGRELFFGMRAHAQTAEQGGGINPATHFTATERVR
jgi:phosphogluconate dehydratase